MRSHGVRCERKLDPPQALRPPAADEPLRRGTVEGIRWLQRAAGNQAVISMLAGRGAAAGRLQRVSMGFDAFLTAGGKDTTAGVAALVSQVKAIRQEFGPANQTTGVSVRLDWTPGGGGGTGAHFEPATQTIVVEVGPAPPGGPPAPARYEDIPPGNRALVWDQVMFEARNAYNDPQQTKAKQVGLFGGALQEGGTAKADVECITLVLYLRDLQALIKKKPAQQHVAFVNGLSQKAQRTIQWFVGAGVATPAQLLTAFRATSHGGAGAFPNTREALASEIMYTVERVEGWDNTSVEKIVFERLQRAIAFGAGNAQAKGAVPGKVAALRALNNRNFTQNNQAVPTLLNFVADVRAAWLGSPPLFDAFLTQLGVSPTQRGVLAGKLPAADQAMQELAPPAAIQQAAALPSQAPQAVAAVLAPADVNQFVTAQLPTEQEMTTELNRQHGSKFTAKAR